MADATPTTATRSRHRRRNGRLSYLTWAAGVVAAGLLALGVTGTLSSWTAAILHNNTNSVATTNAVVLQEKIQGSSTVNADCQSSNGGFSNTSTCTEINKYGGTSSPLSPGGSQTTSVTLTNIGSGPATSLKLTPGTCGQTPAAGTGTPKNPADLCASTATDVNLSLTCVDGTTTTGTAYSDLTYNGALGNFTAVKTHAATIAANASVTCTFTVSLNAAASPLDGGITVSQPLTWELDA